MLKALPFPIILYFQPRRLFVILSRKGFCCFWVAERGKPSRNSHLVLFPLISRSLLKELPKVRAAADMIESSSMMR